MVSKVPFIKPSRASRPRNAFDLSQKHTFTASPGQLLPILSLDLIPHDHVEISASDFMRAMPMNSSSFSGFRSVYEFFAVPYKQLYSLFDQIIAGTNDVRSTAILDKAGGTPSVRGSFNFPTFVPMELIGELASSWSAVKGKVSDPHYRDAVNIYGVPRYDDCLRLLDLLGYGSYQDFSSDFSDFKDSDVDPIAKSHFSPFRILAYNKIYNDFYINTSYESYDSSMFNIDKFSDSKSISSGYISEKRWFDVKYRNNTVDYLTNLRPSMSLTDVAVPSNLGNLLSNRSVYMIPSGAALNDQGSNWSLSASSLRSMFAIDKLVDITNRAGKTFEEQMSAHYGIDVPKSRDGRCQYLGGFDSKFDVSDVTQTSGTTLTGDDVRFGGMLGKVTGKAVGSGSGRIVFDADEHCVLMCIYSLVPDLIYDSNRIDPMVEKTSRFDFFTPEFEDLGMQPLYARNVCFSSVSDDLVLGYQPRYSEYKTALDCNHGQFVVYRPLSSWVSHRFGQVYNGFDTFIPFSSGFTVRNLKIDPRCMNSVFSVSADGREINDNFFGGVNFRIVKVSDMSVEGMPRV